MRRKGRCWDTGARGDADPAEADRYAGLALAVLMDGDPWYRTVPAITFMAAVAVPLKNTSMSCSGIEETMG